MAKDKLTEYSATNASNDVIGDISVAEGMLPSAVNNALREQMTHLKNFSDGTDAIDALAVDNLRLDGNTISSTDTNGDITIDPDGTGDTIIASGNVGIGSSPDTNLDVERSSNDTGGIKVQNTNNAQASAVAQVEISGGDNAYANLLLECNATNHSIRQDGSGNLKFINASTERLRISSTGAVAVGSSNPEALLHVEGASTGQMMFRTSASSVNKWLIGKNSSADFSIGEDGNEWLYVVRDSGNVGIGDSNPQRTLSVNGLGKFLSSITLGGTASSTDSNAYFVNEGFANNSDSSTVSLGTVGTRPLIFATNSTERMRILAGGGLTFNGDTAADNALDDYEQGTWTASYTGGGTLSGGNQTCRYTKIGNLVQVSGSIYYTSVSGGSGDLKITGFPFTQSSGITNYTTASIAVANWSSQAPEQANLVNTQLALLYGGGTSANSPIQTSSLVAYAEIYFSISYATDS